MIRAIVGVIIAFASLAATAATSVCYSTNTDGCSPPGTLTVKQVSPLALPAGLVFSSEESRTTTFVILPDGIVWAGETLGGDQTFLDVSGNVLTVIGNGGTWSLSALSVSGNLSIGEAITARVIINNPNTNQRVLDKTVTLAVVGGVWNAIITTLNPQSNVGQATFLRIVNPNNADALLRLSPTDDEGIAGGPVLVGIPANGATQVTSADLESGNKNKPIDGAFGDGHGKWWIRAAADYPLLIQVFVRNPQTDSLAEVGGVVIQQE